MSKIDELVALGAQCVAGSLVLNNTELAVPSANGMVITADGEALLAGGAPETDAKAKAPAKTPARKTTKAAEPTPEPAAKPTVSDADIDKLLADLT